MCARKYRQKGYQDEDSEPRRSGAQPPRQAREGPRGRGLGAPTRTVFRCRECGEAAIPGEVDPTSVCKRCGAALHACVNCAHFDPSSPRECRQPVAERVPSKTKANDCELFTAKVVAELGDEEKRRSDDPSSARAAFDDLFK